MQFCRSEIAESAGFNHIVEEFYVSKILAVVLRCTSYCVGLEYYLVFLVVGLLQYHACTVGELQFLIAEGSVFFLFCYLSLLWQCGNYRFILHVVHKSLQFLGTHVGNCL